MLIAETKDKKYSIVRDAQWNYYVYCGRDLLRTPGNKVIASEYRGVFETMLKHYDETGDMEKVNEYRWHVKLFDSGNLFGDKGNTVRRVMMNWDENADKNVSHICPGCDRANIKEWLYAATAMQLVAVSETMEILNSLNICYCIAYITEHFDESERDYSAVKAMFDYDTERYIRDFEEFYKYDYEEYGESIPE